MRTAEIGIGEVSTAQVRATKLSTLEKSAAQIGPL
jgi:hypothetical protein